MTLIFVLRTSALGIRIFYNLWPVKIDTEIAFRPFTERIKANGAQKKSVHLFGLPLTQVYCPINY